jgi:thioredoxin-dependent peroxiredoxin
MSVSKAPSFKLPAALGSAESLMTHKDLAGQIVVLYVYPKDDTPGCTREAQAFQASLPVFKKLGAKVVGVSRDTVAKHHAFARRYDLSFPLLSDPTLLLHKALDAWGEKTMYGKKIEGVLRTTVVFAADGKVAKVFRNVKVDGHADAVLEVVRTLAHGEQIVDAVPPKAKKTKKTIASKR